MCSSTRVKTSTYCSRSVSVSNSTTHSFRPPCLVHLQHPPGPIAQDSEELVAVRVEVEVGGPWLRDVRRQRVEGVAHGEHEPASGEDRAARGPEPVVVHLPLVAEQGSVRDAGAPRVHQLSDAPRGDGNLLRVPHRLPQVRRHQEPGVQDRHQERHDVLLVAAEDVWMPVQDVRDSGASGAREVDHEEPVRCWGWWLRLDVGLLLEVPHGSVVERPEHRPPVFAEQAHEVAPRCRDSVPACGHDRVHPSVSVA